MIPAGLPRRYAAWSLDATIIALVALALCAGPVAEGWRRGSEALSSLADAMATMMLQAMQAGMSPLALLRAWTADPVLHAAAARLASAIATTTWPPLLAFALLSGAYFVAFEASRWQATPGKRVLGLRVVDACGGRLRLPRVAWRHAAGALSWLSLNIGHAMAALPPQRRALHDAIAQARVVQVAGDEAPLPAWAKAWLALQALLAVAAFAWLFRAVDAATQAAFDRLL
ncbi:RDD family protein [Luteimonas aestuarii]|uniref:RDD family protein n=1 Tax=Luteimonas aestuarii TaxID=453837 RepID=UPI001404F8F7|nr:RDD family protein [Luteimonas aestuarii]